MNEKKSDLNGLIERFHNENICVQGSVSMGQKHRKLVHNAHNHFVDAGLKQILALLISGKIIGGGTARFYFPAVGWTIYLGTDLTSVTTSSATSLATPIGTSPGTAPNSKSIITAHDGSSDGDWYAIYQSIWNAGTISGTVGEAALYMVDCLQTTFRWESKGTASGQHMFSRLSVADGDFSSFIIDDTVPLVVEWKLRFFFG